MTTNRNEPILDSDANTLTALRALSAEPSAPIGDALQAATEQARLLAALLSRQIRKPLLALQTDFFPSILVKSIDDLPMAGISFWGAGHWHIHVRAEDPTETQNFTVLHSLKHIIDHPLRRQPHSLSNADWEALANHFAHHVLATESTHIATLQEGGAYE